MDAEDEGASEVSLTVNVNEPLEAPFVKKNVCGVLSKSTKTPPSPFESVPLKTLVKTVELPPTMEDGAVKFTCSLNVCPVYTASTVPIVNDPRLLKFVPGVGSPPKLRRPPTVVLSKVELLYDKFNKLLVLPNA